MNLSFQFERSVVVETRFEHERTVFQGGELVGSTRPGLRPEFEWNLTSC